MTMQGRSLPIDMLSLWKMNDQSLGNAETAVRAWFEYSSRLQEHAIKFMSGQLVKDTAAVAQLQNCKSPVDAFNVQLAYVTGAYADVMDEGQKIAGFFSEVASESMAGAAGEKVTSTRGKAKHVQHRISAH